MRGIANSSSNTLTIRARIIASVRGSRRVRRVQRPSSESMETWPFIFSTLFLTTSMPTPLPETLVTEAAVLSPAAKTRPMASRADSVAISASVISPFSRAFFLTASTSMPLPSSNISTRTLLPSLYALSVSCPFPRLPFFSLSSGLSMPWSIEFLIICMRGS